MLPKDTTWARIFWYQKLMYLSFAKVFRSRFEDARREIFEVELKPIAKIFEDDPKTCQEFRSWSEGFWPSFGLLRNKFWLRNFQPADLEYFLYLIYLVSTIHIYLEKR